MYFRSYSVVLQMCGFCSVNVGRFGSVRGAFRRCSLGVHRMFATYWLHTHHTKAWFLQYKSMVFGVQKYGFCNARSGFLEFEYRVIAKR